MEHEILIQKYLDAELTEQELVVFEELLVKDSEFAEELELRSIFYADSAVKLKKELEAALLGVQPSFMEKSAALLDTWLTNLATIVEDFLSQKHLAPSVMMNDAQPTEEKWQIAIAAYGAKKYALAAHQILELNQTSELSKEQKLYLGLSYLYQKPAQNKKAIEQFNQILSSDNKRRKDEANWYISLAYLQNEERQAAKNHLEQIVASNSWKHQEAAQLLSQLNA